MGAVVSCIRDAFRAVGRAIMAVVRGIGGIITAIVNGVVNFIGIIVSFLTCGYCGGKRKGKTGGGHHHSTRTSRV
ncbi:hypothetical protein MN608_02619 [Microdochium nivale]|nr:hypothetical protein MN608_02619 [Microdochium nivale]